MLSYLTTCGHAPDDTYDPPRFLDRSSVEGLSSLPSGRAINQSGRPDHAAEGGKADTAKPMHGLGSGVFEIALAFRGDAFRVIYAVQIGQEVWVVHAFQKKSARGIKTPRHEIDLIRDRLKRLKEIMR